MSDNSTPVSNLKDPKQGIPGVSGPHQSAQDANPSNEPSSGLSDLSGSVKHWIVIPVIMFQSAGFIVLTVVLVMLSQNLSDTPWYVWTALITAFAGMPFGFAANVKKPLSTITLDQVGRPG